MRAIRPRSSRARPRKRRRPSSGRRVSTLTSQPHAAAKSRSRASTRSRPGDDTSSRYARSIASSASSCVPTSRDTVGAAIDRHAAVALRRVDRDPHQPRRAAAAHVDVDELVAVRFHDRLDQCAQLGRDVAVHRVCKTSSALDRAPKKRKADGAPLSRLGKPGASSVLPACARIPRPAAARSISRTRDAGAAGASRSREDGVASATPFCKPAEFIKDRRCRNLRATGSTARPTSRGRPLAGYRPVTTRFALGLGFAAVALGLAPRPAAANVPASARSGSQRRHLSRATTLRPDHLGVYGYDRETSPRLDAFARTRSCSRTHTRRAAGRGPPRHRCSRGCRRRAHRAVGRLDVVRPELDGAQRDAAGGRLSNARLRGESERARRVGASPKASRPTATLVLVPLPRRRRGEPDRAHAHGAGRDARRSIGCASRSPRASTTSTATSAPTATCSPTSSTWSSTSATTSTSRPGAARRVRRHGAPEPHTLDDYRARHALYRTDPDLQAAHAAAPWLLHLGRPRGRRTTTRATARRELDPPELFLRAARRRATRRTTSTCRCRAARSRSGRTRACTRARTSARCVAVPACSTIASTATRRPCPRHRRAAARTGRRDCASGSIPARTLLGREQEAWLHARTRRGCGARWNVIAQQTRDGAARSRAPATRRAPVDRTARDGYPRARERRLLDALRRPATARNPAADRAATCTRSGSTDLHADRGEHRDPIVARRVRRHVDLLGSAPGHRRADRAAAAPRHRPGVRARRRRDRAGTVGETSSVGRARASISAVVTGAAEREVPDDVRARSVRELGAYLERGAD